MSCAKVSRFEVATAKNEETDRLRARIADLEAANGDVLVGESLLCAWKHLKDHI